MASLASKRCLAHRDREAAARCPQCEQFFCRECVTEHDDVVICTSCLRKQDRTETKPSRFSLRWLVRLTMGGAGFIFCWIIFIWIGRILLAFPAEFHEADMWQVGFWERGMD